MACLNDNSVYSLDPPSKVEALYHAIALPPVIPLLALQSSSNRDFDLHASLNIDDDLLDNLGRGVETIVPLVQHPEQSTTATHSINRLWILISKVSHVFDPSPQGVFRVVTLRVLVGRRTGPLTRRSLVFARSMSSWHTFSRDATFRLVRVIRILWVFCAVSPSVSVPRGVRGCANIPGPRRIPPCLCCMTFFCPSRLERVFSYGKVMKVIVGLCVVDEESGLDIEERFICAWKSWRRLTGLDLIGRSSHSALSLGCTCHHLASNMRICW